jgi:hypothetical protein
MGERTDFWDIPLGQVHQTTGAYYEHTTFLQPQANTTSTTLNTTHLPSESSSYHGNGKSQNILSVDLTYTDIHRTS